MINSFAHGGAKYRLVYDLVDIEAAIEAANVKNTVNTLVAMLGQSDGVIPADAEDRLIEQARRKAKCKKSTVEAALREAKITVTGGARTPHEALGRTLLKTLQEQGGAFLLTGGQLWACQAGIWAIQTEDQGWLECRIEQACKDVGFPSTIRLVSEAKAWLKRQPWLHRDTVAWDDHGQVATLSGLLDLRTRMLIPITPEHHVTRVVGCRYDPEAACPLWERMVMDTLLDAEKVALVQEVFGTFLLDKRPKALRRGLAFIGESNSGKSALLDLMAGFFSSRQNNTTFEAIETPHGTASFLDPVPWVLHEAFQQGVWHLADIVKAILSGNTFHVNVKYGPLLSHIFLAAILWASNHPIQFREDSDAIVNRLIQMRCLAQFKPEELRGVALEALEAGYNEPWEYVLAHERAGLLNWALAGLERALTRGYFVLTEESRLLAEEVRQESSLVAGFVKNCVEVDRSSKVGNPDIYAAWARWWWDNKGHDRGRRPGQAAFKKALIRAPGLEGVIGETHTGPVRYTTNVRLNAEGLDFWEGFRISNEQHDISNLSFSRDCVNRDGGDDQPVPRGRPALKTVFDVLVNLKPGGR